MKFGPQAQPSTHWDLNWEPSNSEFDSLNH